MYSLTHHASKIKDSILFGTNTSVLRVYMWSEVIMQRCDFPHIT